MFITELGFSHDVKGDGLVGELELNDEIRALGGALPRASVLATVADVLAGALVSPLTTPRVALTTDLTVRGVQPTEASRVEMQGALLKAGRTLITAEVCFVEPASRRLVALSHATFTPSRRPQDVIELPPLARSYTGRMPRPFPELVGATIVSPGVVELDRTPYVLQPAGTIQGGAVALLGELAAESAMDSPVTDLDLRYLSTIRTGPARTASTVLNESYVRVEIRDVAQPGRLATLAIARTASR